MFVSVWTVHALESPSKAQEMPSGNGPKMIRLTQQNDLMEQEQTLQELYKDIEKRAKSHSFFLANTPRGKWEHGLPQLPEEEWPRFQANPITEISGSYSVYPYQLQHAAHVSAVWDENKYRDKENCIHFLKEGVLSSFNHLIYSKLLKVVPKRDLSVPPSSITKEFLIQQAKLHLEESPVGPKVVFCICECELSHERDFLSEPSASLQDKVKEMGVDVGYPYKVIEADELSIVFVIHPTSARWNQEGHRQPYYIKVPSLAGDGKITEVNPDYINAPVGQFMFWHPGIITWETPEEETRFGRLEYRGDHIYALLEAAIRIENPYLGKIFKYLRPSLSPKQ